VLKDKHLRRAIQLRDEIKNATHPALNVDTFTHTESLMIRHQVINN